MTKLLLVILCVASFASAAEVVSVKFAWRDADQAKAIATWRRLAPDVKLVGSVRAIVRGDSGWVNAHWFSVTRAEDIRTEFRVFGEAGITLGPISRTTLISSKER